MTYRIAYGLDTESMEDPSQLVLIDLPDECIDWDCDGLAHRIRSGEVVYIEQALVGFDDVLDALRQVLANRGLGPLFERIRPDLTDAVLFP